MLHTSFGRSLAMIITCALLLVVSQPLTMLPKTTLAQEATIAINPTHGTPGTHVTVTGAGWPSGWSVPIGIGSSPTPLVTATSTPVPSRVPVLRVSSDHPAPGQTIKVTGSGWTPGETVNLSVSPKELTILKRVTVAENGTFSTSLMIPSSEPRGSQFVDAINAARHKTGQAAITIAGKVPPPPPPTLRTLKVWTADSRNKTKTSFAPGDAIRYMVQATNSGRSTVTARVIFLATGPQQIFSWSGPQAVVSGTPTITLASNVPSDAQAGTYTLTVTVTYNGVSSQGQSQFLVATSTPTWSYDPGNNRGKSSSVSMGDYREPDGKQYDN